MYPFGVIGVVQRYIPAGAVIELAGFRLGCTSTPTGIRETQAGGNRIQGHSSRGGSEFERIRGLKDLSRGGPESRTFPSKVTQGLHPAPSLTKPVRIQGHLSRGGLELRVFPSRVTRGLHLALA